MSGGELFERIQQRADSPFTERGESVLYLLTKTESCKPVLNDSKADRGPFKY